VFVAQAPAPTGGTPRVSRLALRSHYWGVLVVVVASGELNADGAELLSSYLKRVQLDNDVVVDLWDVTMCDPEGIATLEAAKARADEAGWGFALVADAEGACVEALEAAGVETIETYPDRHAAREALQH
jgi:anti-anti-sigma regulatory factor